MSTPADTEGTLPFRVQSFHPLLQHTSEVMALVDRQGRVLFVTPPVQRVLGYPQETLLGRNAFELIHPDDLATTTQAFAAVLAEPGTRLEVVCRARHADGSYRWMEVVATNLLEDLQVGAVLGTFHDITELRQVQEAFGRGEAVLRTLIDAVPSLIWIADPQGRVTFHNDQWLAYTGLAQDGHAQDWPELVLHPQDHERYRRSWHAAVQQGTPYEIEVRLKRHDGVYRWFLTRALPLREAGGTILAWFGSTTDIHDQKLVEAELGRYEAIVASSEDAILSKTLDGTITSWNEAAERLFGYSAAEAIGQPITLLIPEELHQEEADILLQLRQGQHIQHYETIRLSKDGSRVEVSLSISPVTDRVGTIIGAATIARDIGERRDLERSKDEFISAASHELKTPLTMLKAFAQLLPRRLESGGTQAVAPMLARMEAQVDRLTRLIDELLDVSKMQAGQLDYEELPVDLDALVEESVELLQPTCTTHLLRVTGATNAILMGDRDRLGQVLTNLITNAVKYSPGASIVDIVLAAAPQAVIVSVHDYGVGIPTDQQPHIFERFYRVKARQQQIVPGLGMGLYIAAEIIKRHGGTISVESEEGQGSTFLVSLPLK